VIPSRPLRVETLSADVSAAVDEEIVKIRRAKAGESRLIRITTDYVLPTGLGVIDQSVVVIEFRWGVNR
jgi:hypothetical protein